MILPFVLSTLLAEVHVDPAVAAGKLAYTTRCSSCHGDDLRGGVNAPSLRGVGAADLDFWMTTGRMPAALPWVQVGHRGSQIDRSEIHAIEAYVTSVAPGGPPIPALTTGADVDRGRVLFAQNCRHCHGVEGAGASIGGSAWAPSLHQASSVQVAEAIRVGPGNMPKFGPSELDPQALSDVVHFVGQLATDADAPSVPLRSSGPVPEGLYGWLCIGTLALLSYAFSKRRPAADAPRPPDDDSH